MKNIKESTALVSNLKPPVDLMGTTEKTLKFIAEYIETAMHEADEKMIKPEKVWAYIMQNIKAESKITDELLAYAGLPASILMEALDITEDAPAATPAYKKLQLKMKDGSVKEIQLADALAKIQPFTKNFANSTDALVKGDAQAILKVMQHVFGADVVQWTVPAEKESVNMPALSAAALVEAYAVAKFDKESVVYEMKAEKLVVRDGVVKGLVDAFDKSAKEYLLKMFPNTTEAYPLKLLAEAKTVLNLLDKAVMDKLFPNINDMYLSNLRESEQVELIKKLQF